MSELSRIFAHYALSRAVTCPAAQASAKTFILDSLGVGIAGSKAPFSDAVYNTTRLWGNGDAAHVWGRGVKLPTASAAYMNAFQIHAMEYDCVHEAAVVHPMATIFAALSAEAETQGRVTGRALLDAVIIAVDVAVELGVAVTSPLKFFRPATAGLFGATLGIARLRGLDEAMTLSAMGCALAQCAGVMQAHVEGKPTLPVQIAGAARAAVVACDLAENGLFGPEHSLEGPYGYFQMFEDTVDLKAAAASIGKTHRISEVSWKPYPTGRAAQGGIVLIQMLREQGMKVGDIATLVLSAPPIISRLVNRPIEPAMTANYARLCFPYLGAVAATRDTVGLEDFRPNDLHSSDLAELAMRISIVTNDVTDPAAFIPQTMNARLRDGTMMSAKIETLFGSPEAPLSTEQHLSKFRRCVAFGLSEVKAKAVADGLIDIVDNLERSEDCGDLFVHASGL